MHIQCFFPCATWHVVIMKGFEFASIWILLISTSTGLFTLFSIEASEIVSLVRPLSLSISIEDPSTQLGGVTRKSRGPSKPKRLKAQFLEEFKYFFET